jgi:hypothetical protein
MNDAGYKPVRILHLDDQPENVSWIPRKINDWFWKRFRQDMSKTVFMDENDEETHFKIFLNFRDELILLEYFIYVESAQLINAINSPLADPALIILDQAIKDDFESGGRAFKEIERITNNVIILTAYPQETCRQLNWSEKDERLFSKPPEILRLLDRFVQTISPVISPSSHKVLSEFLKDEEAG